MDIGWFAFLSSTGIYELAPGFLAGTLAAVAVTLCTEKPSGQVEALFDEAVSFTE